MEPDHSPGDRPVKFILMIVLWINGPAIEYGEFDSYQECTTVAETIVQAERFWCISKELRVE